MLALINFIPALLTNNFCLLPMFSNNLLGTHKSEITNLLPGFPVCHCCGLSMGMFSFHSMENNSFVVVAIFYHKSCSLKVFYGLICVNI